MAKPNYRQAKRQKELARKARQEHKMQRRTARTLSTGKDSEQDVPTVGEEPERSSSTHDT